MPHTKRAQSSIIGRMHWTLHLLSILLLVPALISLMMMLSFRASYNESITHMETVSNLKPMVETLIPEQLWALVAGQADIGQCGVYQTINTINATLDSITTSQLELIVAQRTMNTLMTYVKQIDANMSGGVPVVESERLLEEVRDVASLAASMLEDYITWEIGQTAVKNQRLRNTVLISTLAGIALIMIALFLSRRASNRMVRFIHKPLEQLEHFAGSMAEGDLTVRVPATDVEELKTLTEGVNNMVDRLEELIAQNRREQEKLKKAELRILQAQINPHFLYNTLDAIMWQAESGNSAQVIEITRALSDFFRISLSSGLEWIPLREELKHLTGYLSIQKIRYRDILDYCVDVPDELGETYVLKLILQPLVENALYHGIKHKRGGGTITVTGRRMGGVIQFCVADTGSGMNKERLDEVLAAMRLSEFTPVAENVGAGSGFGLSNVNLRIRLYYNTPDGLQIHSDPGGTRVSYRLPMKTKEDVYGH